MKYFLGIWGLLLWIELPAQIEIARAPDIRPVMALQELMTVRVKNNAPNYQTTILTLSFTNHSGQKARMISGPVQIAPGISDIAFPFRELHAGSFRIRHLDDRVIIGESVVQICFRLSGFPGNQPASQECELFRFDTRDDRQDTLSGGDNLLRSVTMTSGYDQNGLFPNGRSFYYGWGEVSADLQIGQLPVTLSGRYTGDPLEPRKLQYNISFDGARLKDNLRDKKEISSRIREQARTMAKKTYYDALNRIRIYDDYLEDSVNKMKWAALAKWDSLRHTIGDTAGSSGQVALHSPDMDSLLEAYNMSAEEYRLYKRIRHTRDSLKNKLSALRQKADQMAGRGDSLLNHFGRGDVGSIASRGKAAKLWPLEWLHIGETRPWIHALVLGGLPVRGVSLAVQKGEHKWECGYGRLKLRSPLMYGSDLSDNNLSYRLGSFRWTGTSHRQSWSLFFMHSSQVKTATEPSNYFPAKNQVAGMEYKYTLGNKFRLTSLIAMSASGDLNINVPLNNDAARFGEMIFGAPAKASKYGWAGSFRITGSLFKNTTRLNLELEHVDAAYFTMGNPWLPQRTKLFMSLGKKLGKYSGLDLFYQNIIYPRGVYQGPGNQPYLSGAGIRCYVKKPDRPSLTVSFNPRLEFDKSGNGGYSNLQVQSGYKYNWGNLSCLVQGNYFSAFSIPWRSPGRLAFSVLSLDHSLFFESNGYLRAGLRAESGHRTGRDQWQGELAGGYRSAKWEASAGAGIRKWNMDWVPEFNFQCNFSLQRFNLSLNGYYSNLTYRTGAYLSRHSTHARIKIKYKL